MTGNRKRCLLLLLALLQCLLCACAPKQPDVDEMAPAAAPETAADDAAAEPSAEPAAAAADQWLSRPLNVIDDKYRTYYEVFVYSFYDSDRDGIGDLKGVTEKLDYIQELGFNGIWLMPIMPSPTYHKYDTTDYMDIDPEYGTLEDFQTLLEACHQRGIRVIVDLAMNHTSSQHPWFLEACSYLQTLPEGAEPDAEDCPYAAYYHFRKEGGSGYSQVSGTDWYYECQFWDGMPDLNLENPAVRREFEEIAAFWLDMGVDGFRLDAVKEYVSGSVESNIEILTWFNDYVKSLHEDCYLVCECWTDKTTYAQYYASGVDSLFDFDFAQKTGVITGILTGARGASAYGKFMEENEALYASYSDTYINAPFYTNHDLGRTTGYYPGDEGEAKTKMGNAMNLLMTGNVFVYYGEELGMKGSGSDENKRAPMYWSQDAGAEGMCRGPADMDSFEMKFGSLEEQAEDPDSVYSYVKQAILLRNQNPDIARGAVTFQEAYSDDSICVMTKAYEGRELLLVFNPTAESVSASLEGLSVQEKPVRELTILGQLLTGEEPVTVDGNDVTMPAFSVLVMGVE